MSAELLKKRAGDVTEVGFNNMSHSAQAFREPFGVTPSQYGRSFDTSY